MLKFTKGDAVKLIDPESKLIPVLKEQGWVVEGGKAEDTDKDSELEALKAEADAMGLKYHHKAGAEKLADLIAEAKSVE